MPVRPNGGGCSWHHPAGRRASPAAAGMCGARSRCTRWRARRAISASRSDQRPHCRLRPRNRCPGSAVQRAMDRLGRRCRSWKPSTPIGARAAHAAGRADRSFEWWRCRASGWPRKRRARPCWPLPRGGARLVAMVNDTLFLAGRPAAARRRGGAHHRPMPAGGGVPRGRRRGSAALGCASRVMRRSRSTSRWSSARCPTCCDPP